MNTSNKIKTLLPSILISITSICFYAFHIDVLLSPNSELNQRMFYIFTHSNIFHLAANLIALYRFRPRIKTCAIAFLVSFAVTFIPFVHLSVPTCGLSGFLMACFARHYHAWKKPIWPLVLANLVFIPVPYVNWRIHTICFIISYLIYAFMPNRRR